MPKKNKSIQTAVLIVDDEQKVPQNQETPVLDPNDIKYMRKREDLVIKGIKVSVLATIALREIRDYKDGILWKSYKFPNFLVYCRRKFGYARRRAYQLLSSGEVIHEIEAYVANSESKELDWMPTNESHLLPLLKLQSDKQGECWKAVVSQKKPAELSAKFVKAEVSKFIKAHDLTSIAKKAKPRPSVKKKFLAGLEKLRPAIDSLSKGDEIAALFVKIKDLVG